VMSSIDYIMRERRSPMDLFSPLCPQSWGKIREI
jgi:hypothetical protein